MSFTPKSKVLKRSPSSIRKTSTPSYKISWRGKHMLIKTPTKLKQGSAKSMQIIEDITCENIDTLKQGKFLGGGADGEVYCYLNDCEYVVKLQYYSHEEDLKDIKKEKRKTNLAHKYGIAPKIHKIIACKNEETIIIVMDRAKGNDLWIWLEENELTKKDIEALFNIFDYLHERGIVHGDLNPGNIMYNGSKFTLIDFEPRESGFKAVYDFGTLFFYIPAIAEINTDIADKIIFEVSKRIRHYANDKKIFYLLRALEEKDFTPQDRYRALSDIAFKEFF